MIVQSINILIIIHKAVTQVQPELQSVWVEAGMYILPTYNLKQTYPAVWKVLSLYILHMT